MFNKKAKTIKELENKIKRLKEQNEAWNKWSYSIESYYMTAHVAERQEIKRIGKHGRIKWEPVEIVSDSVVKIYGTEYDLKTMGNPEYRTISEIKYTGDRPGKPDTFGFARYIQTILPVVVSR